MGIFLIKLLTNMNTKNSKQINDYSVHLRLTDIMNMHEIQSILLKFWHLAYTSDTQKPAFSNNINFSNCFIYEMGVESYRRYFLCLIEALKSIINPKNFNVINSYLTNNGKAQLRDIQDVTAIQVSDIFQQESRLKSISNFRTPTKRNQDKSEHLPSLLDSSQKCDLNPSNSKSQSRHFNNLKSAEKEFDGEEHLQDNLKEDNIYINQNGNNQNLQQIHSVMYSQAHNQINTNQHLNNAQNTLSNNLAPITQLQSQNTLQLQSRINSNTLKNQNTSFQESFQPYYMRTPLPLSSPLKTPQIKDKNQVLNSLGLQNSFMQSDSKNSKARSSSFYQQQIDSRRANSTIKDRFERKTNAIQDNNRIRREFNNNFSSCYPYEDKMKDHQKTNISSYVLGGYDLIDYSDSINKLHRKLLRKVVLNR